MAVFYNSRSGLYEVASQSLNPLAEANFLGLEAQLHTGTGWHEYSTVADMQQAVASNKWPAPKSGSNPANLPAGAATGAVNTAKQAVQAVTGSGIWGSIPWLRLGEFTLGLLLIAVGVAHMTRAVPIATRIAKAVT